MRLFVSLVSCLLLCSVLLECAADDADNDVYELTDEDFAAAAGNMTKEDMLKKGYLDGTGVEGTVDPIKDSPYFEGDIAFPEGLSIWNFATPVDKTDVPDSDRVDSAIRNQHKLWTNAVVPYEIRGTTKTSQRLRIAQAIQEYNLNTCIKWKPRRGEKDFVYIKTGSVGSGCWSYVGKSGGGQPINLEPGCYSKGIVMHEMMHALGFFHEQSRADRDDNVRILFENITPGKEHNFKRYTLAEIQHLGTEYDCSSIMHYGSTAFSKDPRKLKTILPKGKGCVIVGHRDDFSPIDKLDLNRLYKCPVAPGWKTLAKKSQLWRFLNKYVPGGIEPGDKYISLNSHHNKWVAAEKDDTKSLTNTRDWILTWERFVPTFLDNRGTVALKSWHGFYWSAQPDGRLVADRTKLGPWEKFTVYINEKEDQIGLKSFHGKWVSAQPKGEMTADRDRLGAWEKFTGWKIGPKNSWKPWRP